MKNERIQPNIGYNSYSDEFRSLQEIYEYEDDKGNDHILKAIKKVFPTKKSRKNVSAIWIEHDPLACFKHYVLDANRFYDEDEDVLKEYPDYLDEVCKVNLSNLAVILGDDDIGYLYVKKSMLPEGYVCENIQN